MQNNAIFICQYNIDNSPSILNLLGYLLGKGRVTLYLRNVRLFNAGILLHENLTTINLDKDSVLIPAILRARLSGFKRSLDDFDNVICFDPKGLILCNLLFPAARPYYYSLELYLKNDHFGLDYPSWLSSLERRAVRRIRGLIIQSQEKDHIFRREHALSAEIPTFILPVTYRGTSSIEKSSYIREKFSIDSARKIALHLGGVAGWFSCIELAMQFSRLTDWALVFHGYQNPVYALELKNIICRNAMVNIYVNDEQFADLKQVDEVVRSCDLGVAWYNDISLGFRTAGHSSGKIPSYMRFGLPVIAKKYRSTLEAIEYVGAGICIDSFDEIAGAIKRIEVDYDNYSRQARRIYDANYNFEVYTGDLERFLAVTK